MAFNDHNSDFFQTIPVTIQNKQAIDSIIMLRGYTSRLVNTTPTTVMILANHPISLLCFVKKCNLSFPRVDNPNILFCFVYLYSTIINLTAKLAAQIIK